MIATKQLRFSLLIALTLAATDGWAAAPPKPRPPPVIKPTPPAKSLVIPKPSISAHSTKGHGVAAQARPPSERPAATADVLPAKPEITGSSDNTPVPQTSVARPSFTPSGPSSYTGDNQNR